MGEGRVLGGQPRHYICTNAWRGLSATAEFPVLYLADEISNLGFYSDTGSRLTVLHLTVVLTVADA